LRFRGTKLDFFRRHMHASLRSLIDPEDLVQEYFTQLFTRRLRSHVACPAEWQWAQLVLIARRVLLACHRRFLDTEKRDVRRSRHVPGRRWLAWAA
jgi:hypothetical protein